MKFFWKIFLSFILINMIFFSLGSYYLIYSNFTHALQREINVAYNENDVLIYSLSRELQTSRNQNPNLFNSETTNVWIEQAVKSIVISASRGAIPFRISDDMFRNIYSSKWPNIDSTLLTQLTKENRGYEVIYLDGQCYIHVASPIEVLGEHLYIENYNIISHLFDNRRQQYKTAFYLMIIILFISGVVAFIVSSWLMYPIRRLSQITKRFASGELSERIEVTSQDELGMLTQEFNKIAEELEEKIEELKDAKRRQEHFVGSFAHEIKTPLTSMIGYADRLRSKKMNEEQVILSAHYIYEEGKRLEALSMKLLELIVLKKQDFTFKKVNSETFFSSIEETMRPIIEKAHIEFVASWEDANLLIEQDLMKTVCLNLLDNARKAITANGKILLNGKVILGGYEISISDNGRGIETEELGRITEAFYTVDKSRARLQGGAGLGLSICLEIVKLHGGELIFESQINKGTCVTIRLKGDSIL